MDLTKTSRQARCLQSLADAKDRLLDSFAGLDTTVLCSEPVTGDWTIKDILGHTVSWNEEFRACIEMIRQGQHPGYERVIRGDANFEEWNRGRIAQKRAWSWQRIRDDVDRDYREAVQFILGLEPGDWRKRGVTPWMRAALERPADPTDADTETVETLISYHWRHMNEHTHMIAAWRKQRGLG